MDKKNPPDYISCKDSYSDIVHVSQIKPNPENPNKHKPEDITSLALLLRYQGIRKPLIVSNQSGMLATGHGTLMAVIENGWEYVPVSYQDFESYEQEYAHLVADNASAQKSELDYSLINRKLEDLGPDINLDFLGIQNFTVDPLERDVNFKAKEGSKELSESEFQQFDHKCPKCQFEFND